ncbi:GAF and ANTAR domain-containing protein [Nocardia sp. NPDC050713]|uniref:GAF and ANTAR domain-containing protein n=1 Tax=Nocardia sp. NPDC050713 TaxID=3154511 RepID=UPI0033CD6896
MGAHAPLLDVLVRSVGTLTSDFDVVELSQQLVDACTELTGGAEAGLFLGDHRGELRVLAATHERARWLVEAVDGPTRQAYRTSSPAIVDDLAATLVWPEFARHALEHGYRSTYALPLRLRTDNLGALTIFGAAPGALDRAAVRSGQILADLAAIGIAQHVLRPRIEPMQARLPVALQDRVVIEQAKGVLAERGDLDMTEAFGRLRAHARRCGLRLAELAGAIVVGSVDAAVVLGTPTER